jgi:predicted TIM-barrel fold metal-dependent hydrolase
VTPRRAWFAISALALVLLAVALATATGLESHTRGFAGFRGLGIWKIDFHEQADPEVLGAAVNVAASQGILGIVNLGGGQAGAGLERQVEAAARFPGRVLVFMSLDGRGCCDDAWADREVARLVTGRALGARGLHVPRDLAGPRGVPVQLDSPALDPVWATAGGLGIPVAIHRGEGPDATGELTRLLERHPGIPFVALHLADLAGDPAALSSLLVRLPNLYLDTAGRVIDLARDPERSREFLVTHADRVLFGTDLVWMQGPKPESRALVLGSGPPVRSLDQLRRFFDSTWRFYETRDTTIPPPTPPAAPSPSPAAPDPKLRGLGLPRDVLTRIFHGNARKLLGFADLEAQ